MVAEVRALEGATFAPTLSEGSKRGAYADVRPRLNLKQVGAAPGHGRTPQRPLPPHPHRLLASRLPHASARMPAGGACSRVWTCRNRRRVGTD